jgi:hypothetical protein
MRKPCVRQFLEVLDRSLLFFSLFFLKRKKDRSSTTDGLGQETGEVFDNDKATDFRLFALKDFISFLYCFAVVLYIFIVFYIRNLYINLFIY